MPSLRKIEQRPGSAADESLGQIIWDLGRAYYAYVGLAERILVDEGLDDVIQPGMGHVLFALYEQDNLPIKDIAARSQLAYSSLSRILTRMEKVGLIERSRDAVDGRIVRIGLTPLGKQLEAKCREMVQRVTAITHAGIGEKNVPRAKALLQSLTAAYREEEQRLAQGAKSR
jgi:DNA-binding MarR family transcriptional regulator